MPYNIQASRLSENSNQNQAPLSPCHTKEWVITALACVAIGSLVVGVLTIKRLVPLNFKLGVGLIGGGAGAGCAALVLTTVWFICAKEKESPVIESRPQTPKVPTVYLKSEEEESHSESIIDSCSEEDKEETPPMFEQAPQTENLEYKTVSSEVKEEDELEKSQSKSSEKIVPIKIEEAPKVEELKEFKGVTLKLFFSDRTRRPIELHNTLQLKAVLEEIQEKVYANHASIQIEYDPGFAFNRTTARMKEGLEFLQNSPLAQNLAFHISNYASWVIFVHPKPSEVKDIGFGYTHRTYSNGTTENFKLNLKKGLNHEGVRYYKDGREEHGVFDADSGKLRSGFIRVAGSQDIELFNPQALIEYDSKEQNGIIGICEGHNKLVVFEKSSNRVLDNISVEEALLKGACQLTRGIGYSLLPVIQHSYFQGDLKQLIEKTLKSEDSLTPLLFKFSDKALVDIIKIGSEHGLIDPLKIVDPVTNRDLFLESAHRKSEKLLTLLIELFPEQFKLNGQTVIIPLLLAGEEDDLHLLRDLSNKFIKLGGDMEPFYRLELVVAAGDKFDRSMRASYRKLDTEQKQKLADLAYAYNNPHLHESAQVPVKAHEYSINLMWINKTKIPENQEFLFGQDQEEFAAGFVEPVTKWVLANPGTRVNIWVDKAMATEGAIERSRSLLEKALEGKEHELVEFRDVRSIDLVTTNPTVFDEKMPIKFRAQLLRAIVADYTLSQKETKYFVYGDLDMKALSTRQLFDKRTVNFLDDYGIVLAKDNFACFANGFLMLNGEKGECMDSHRKVVIDLSIEMALEKPQKIQDHQICSTYPAMLTHLLDKDGRFGKLKKSMTLQDFRYDKFKERASSILPLGEEKTELRSIMPRKPVPLPISYF